MKRLVLMFRGSCQKGFTLVELLIVIAVIGVLATAVLAAINPVEQIKKAQDTSKKSDAAEFLNAVERYFATFEKNPWTVVASGVALSTAASSGVTELVAKNELKSQFATRSNLTSIFVTGALDDVAKVCFAPGSKTFRAKAKFSSNVGATDAATCPKADLSAGCFICIPE